MTIGLLLIFTYSTVQLKMPKEVHAQENVVIQTVISLPFLNRFTYFEIAYILKTVLYPSLFNLTLNISRVIDVEPILEFKRRILDAQKKLTKSFLPLEMMIKKRENDTVFHEMRDKEDVELAEALAKVEAANKEKRDAHNLKIEEAKAAKEAKEAKDAPAIEAAPEGASEVELTET